MEKLHTTGSRGQGGYMGGSAGGLFPKPLEQRYHQVILR